MTRVIVPRFGGTEVLEVRDEPLPSPGPGEVRVALTSIGMNHADLMARRGEYKLSSGEPPFSPGLEGGGRIDAVGEGVTNRKPRQRVLLTADAPRLSTAAGSLAGTYCSHFIARAEQTIPAPDTLPDEQLGTLWLPYLTAWGCLAWQQKLRPGQYVAIPAASSSVGMAAAQVTRAMGAIPIGLTTSSEKAERLKGMPESAFEHYVVTNSDAGISPRWHRDLFSLTGGKGVDVFFDPVASGDYLNTEIRTLAQHGTIWVYGLLGEPGTVDVTPLIRKYGSIRGWVLSELIMEGGDALTQGYEYILRQFANGTFRQHIGGRFQLKEVALAHEEMERGKHIGKLVLIP